MPPARGAQTGPADGERVHAALLERVGATRALLTRGVTPQEYRAVLDVLRRVAANLERAAAGP